MEYLEEHTRSTADWRKFIPYTPAEKAARSPMKISATEFRRTIWEPGVGEGGIFGEYLEHDRTLLPYITAGEDGRYRRSWNNNKHLPPCAHPWPARHPPRARRPRL